MGRAPGAERRATEHGMTASSSRLRIAAFPLVAILTCAAGLGVSLGQASAQEKGSNEPSGSAQEPPGKRLIEHLGCVVCHTLQRETTTVRAEAPDLTHEGDKVRPEWLFEFLKRPHSLRPWLRGRMANFQLSDREAVALTEYIRQDLRDRAAPALPEKMRLTGEAPKEIAKVGAQLASKEYFDCFSCHMVGKQKPEGPPEGWAPDLAMAAGRLNPDWIARWLRDPQKIQAGTKMPMYFSGPGSGPPNILGGDETRQLLALRAWLLDFGRASESAPYEKAKAAYRDASPEEGRRLAEELNCGGCHRIPGLSAQRKVAPVLSYAGSKFRKDWLTAFLKNPRRIRPAGYVLGWRSRMPDFRLSDEEVGSIADYLMTLTYPGLQKGLVAEGETLDRVERLKGAKLLETTEGCIGCHRVKSRRGEIVGGFSGPDLSEAGQRLQGDFIYHFIRNPRAFEPQGRMVIFGHFLSDTDAKALAEYLSAMK